VFKCIVNALGAFLRIFTEVTEMNWLFSLGALVLFVWSVKLFFHNLPDIAKWTGKIFLLVFLIQCLVNMVRNYLLPHAKRICSPKQIMINILLALGALLALFSVIYATTVLLRPHPSGSVLFYVDHISEFSFQMENLFIPF